MDIVGGFDVHRKQITFDYIEMDSGEVHRSKIRPATRQALESGLMSSPIGSPVSRSPSPWRLQPAGATSSRRSSVPGSSLT
jgi:hypothetical protein